MLTGHDRLIKDRPEAGFAAVRALLADGATIRKQKQVAVALDPVFALCTTETVFAGKKKRMQARLTWMNKINMKNVRSLHGLA